MLKQLEIGSAISIRLIKITGKSKEPIHPKHFLHQTPWFVRHINQSDVILDLGSGNGQGAIKAAKVAKKVTGIEIDHRIIEIAKKSALKKKLKNINFNVGNLEKKINFKNNSFDKIIFLDVLEHLNERGQIMSEIKRTLKPNGLLFLSVPNSQTSWKKLQRSVGICSFSDPDHKIEFTEESIKKLLSNYDFELIQFNYAPTDTPFRGLFDIIGSLSLGLYKKISNWRLSQSKRSPQEAVGFEIIAKNKK